MNRNKRKSFLRSINFNDNIYSFALVPDWYRFTFYVYCLSHACGFVFCLQFSKSSQQCQHWACYVHQNCDEKRKKINVSFNFSQLDFFLLDSMNMEWLDISFSINHSMTLEFYHWWFSLIQSIIVFVLWKMNSKKNVMPNIFAAANSM